MNHWQSTLYPHYRNSTALSGLILSQLIQAIKRPWLRKSYPQRHSHLPVMLWRAYVNPSFERPRAYAS